MVSVQHMKFPWRGTKRQRQVWETKPEGLARAFFCPKVQEAAPCEVDRLCGRQRIYWHRAICRGQSPSVEQRVVPFATLATHNTVTSGGGEGGFFHRFRALIEGGRGQADQTAQPPPVLSPDWAVLRSPSLSVSVARAGEAKMPVTVFQYRRH